MLDEHPEQISDCPRALESGVFAPGASMTAAPDSDDIPKTHTHTSTRYPNVGSSLGSSKLAPGRSWPTSHGTSTPPTRTTCDSSWSS